MQNQDDDFPYSSDDPSLTPGDDKNAVLGLSTQQVSDLKGTLRLVVGSAMTGKDAYTKRLRHMQAMQETVKPDAIVINENEASRDQLKYLLLGILFETPDLLQRGLETAGGVSTKIFGLISRIFSPFANSWIFSPAKEQIDSATSRGEQVIDRLIMKGRIEEQNSRRILQQQAIDDLVNELLEYVILKTEVQDLIEEAGIGVAGGVVDEFRDQSSNVDSMIDRKLRSMFHKRTPTQSVTPPNEQADGE
jgi:polyhydroxyalkanoate synthesis regulator phasin